MTESLAPVSLRLIDRSRSKTALARCPRARFLEYSLGGYGMVPKAESLPLATGLSAHQGLEAFAKHLKETSRLPTTHEVRAVIAQVVADYHARVDERGFRGILSSADTEITIAEQAGLIEGLLWALVHKVLPWLHQTYQVIAVEEERLHFLHCTCGAPPLDADEHVRRGCGGQALMIRSDLLARKRGTTSLAYFECKTTGWESSAWAEQWETDPQLALGTVDVEARYGGEVTELFIIGLNKGRRAVDRDNPEGRKRQHSPLVYGYRRPGNPPLAPEDWLPSYETVLPDGTVKRASRAHRAALVPTELQQSDWPVWLAARAEDPGVTPVEAWVRLLPPSVLDKVCFVLGPLNRQDHQLQATLRAMQGEEDRWQATEWRVYELEQQYGWASEVFQAELDRLIPCSWNCRPFGREHQCAYVPVCHRHEGWQDPLGSGRYQPRLPHHTPELQQAIARGLRTADAATGDDEE